jgi:shikimate kinase/3-dehydroquinate synthase
MMNTQKYIDVIKNNLDKSITLVGLMGAGKTTVGRILADMLDWPFYDSDDEIVRSVGKSISAIFEEEGEPAFRELERMTLRGLVKNKQSIIATGGGSISIPETAEVILENSLCIWLDAPVDVLVERTKGSDRPLLKHSDPREVLEKLSEKRKTAYQQSHIHILDDDLSPEDTANRVLMQIYEFLLDEDELDVEEDHIPPAICHTVSLFDRSYPIFMGAGLLENPEMWLSQDLMGKKAYIITDYNVRANVVDKFQSALSPHMKSVAVMELPPGEQTKSFDRYESVMDWLLEGGIKRDSLIFAVGGGVIGDLAGFAASTALRGIQFIQIPTTLLSMVDSSVGGKTGINSKHGKNLIGAFYQPQAVVIDMDVLKTLPKREWLSGYAEIVKYGLLGDAEFFKWLEINVTKLLEGSPVAVMRAIEKSVHMKAEIVATDEYETNGQRARLNLGHTFGHALESLTGYSADLLHGESVAIGCVLAARLSQALGHLDEIEVLRIEHHFKTVGLRTAIRDIKFDKKPTADDIVALMRKDKKSTQAGMAFIIMTRLGDSELSTTVPENLVYQVVEQSL